MALSATIRLPSKAPRFMGTANVNRSNHMPRNQVPAVTANGTFRFIKRKKNQVWTMPTENPSRCQAMANTKSKGRSR